MWGYLTYRGRSRYIYRPQRHSTGAANCVGAVYFLEAGKEKNVAEKKRREYIGGVFSGREVFQEVYFFCR